MSTHTFHTPFNPRHLISERSARRAAAHPRAVAAPDAAAAPAEAAPTEIAPTAGNDSASSAGNPQILRRWSVTQLVAAATWPRVIASAMLPPPAARS